MRRPNLLPSKPRGPKTPRASAGPPSTPSNTDATPAHSSASSSTTRSCSAPSSGDSNPRTPGRIFPQSLSLFPRRSTPGPPTPCTPCPRPGLARCTRRHEIRPVILSIQLKTRPLTPKIVPERTRNELAPRSVPTRTKHSGCRTGRRGPGNPVRSRLPPPRQRGITGSFHAPYEPRSARATASPPRNPARGAASRTHSRGRHSTTSTCPPAASTHASHRSGSACPAAHHPGCARATTRSGAPSPNRSHTRSSWLHGAPVSSRTRANAPCARPGNHASAGAASHAVTKPRRVQSIIAATPVSYRPRCRYRLEGIDARQPQARRPRRGR